jgi:hypothetical protein
MLQSLYAWFPNKFSRNCLQGYAEQKYNDTTNVGSN